MREGKPAGIIVGTGINFATPPELLPAEVAGSLREDLLPGASRNEVAAAMVREMRDTLPGAGKEPQFPAGIPPAEYSAGQTGAGASGGAGALRGNSGVH